MVVKSYKVFNHCSTLLLLKEFATMHGLAAKGKWFKKFFANSRFCSFDFRVTSGSVVVSYVSATQIDAEWFVANFWTIN